MFVERQARAEAASSSETCVQWVAFRDAATGLCRPCSACPDGHLAVVLCEYERDTLCRPLTDLGEHVQGLPVMHRQSVDRPVGAGEVTDLPSLAVLLVCLGAAALLSALTALFFLVRGRWRGAHHRAWGPNDPLERGLLSDDEDQLEVEPGKLAADMDQLLAVLYCKSLVTNNYTP